MPISRAKGLIILLCRMTLLLFKYLRHIAQRHTTIKLTTSTHKSPLSIYCAYKIFYLSLYLITWADHLIPGLIFL